MKYYDNVKKRSSQTVKYALYNFLLFLSPRQKQIIMAKIK